MDDLKRTYREGETGAKESWRDADGTDLKDQVGNMGDEARKDMGNVGDKLRHGTDHDRDDADTRDTGGL
ncbi:MAG TPA: hypothetical protein VF763_04185 [Candidatus Limnocylindrales bacterium]